MVKRRTITDAPPSAPGKDTFRATAKSLLTRVRTLLARSGPIVSLPIDAEVTSELTELFVRMAEQWATAARWNGVEHRNRRTVS